MLMLHNGTADYKKLAPDIAAGALPAQVTWIDILDGTAEEISFVERAIGRHLPTLPELKEIESSSRLRFDKNVFCLSAPVVSGIPSGHPQTAPVGFILMRDLLVTVRFEDLTAFSSFEREYVGRASAFAKGAGAFIGLVNAIVDRSADVLENVGNELDEISEGIFHRETQPEGLRYSPVREAKSLKDVLRRVGYSGSLSSKIRDSLLGLRRIVSYVSDMGPDWFTADLRGYKDAQLHDIVSLTDYNTHLTNKIQLLLEATMGLISIEQNNTIKVLTVVSVVGVPPTLVASLYGMNFVHMPELSWAYGYPFGLALIAISAIGPVVWFKLRGWL